MAERWTTDQIKAKIKEVADQEGVPYELALGVATQESYLNPDSVGDGGNAKGLFQLHPGAAIDVGMNPLMRHVPALNITGGVKYLKQKLKQAGGDEDKALLLYNGGGDPNYVQNVRRMMGQQGDNQGTKGGTTGGQSGDKGFKYTQEDVQKFLSEVNQSEQPQGEQALPGQYEQGEIDPKKGLVINIEKGPGLGTDRPELKPTTLTQLSPEMDDDEILRQLGYDPEMVKQSQKYTPGMFKQMITDPNSTATWWGDTPIGGAARGAFDVMQGGAQIALRGLEKFGLASKADVALQEARDKVIEADYQQNIRKGQKVDSETGESGLFSDPSRLAGNIIATAPLPGGAPTTLARTALRAGATGAVQSALQPSFSTSPQVGSEQDTYWSNKGAQAATGVVLGGTIGTAMEKGVAPALNRGYNYLKGIGPKGGPAQRMADIAERHNIRMSYGQATQNKGVQTVESVLTAVPGTGGTAQRLGQQADVMQEAPRVVDRALDVMRRTGWKNLSQVRAAARQGGPRGQDAQILLDEIANAGDDWGRIIQSSGKLSLFNDRLKATKLYDKVEALAKTNGLGNVQPSRTVKAIDDALAEVDQLPALLPEVRQKVQQSLRQIRDEITPKTVPVPQGPQPQLNPNFSPNAQPQIPTQQPRGRVVYPDTSYERLRRLDSHLGSLKRGAVEPQTAHYLGPVRQALRNDMDDFAQQSGIPELTQAHQEANRFYRERVVKYREGQLANAIKGDLPDEIYKKFVKQGADRARYFYEGLDPKGQSAVRYGMIEEAYQDATKVDPGIFHPGRFAQSMQKIQDARGVFFKGQAAKEVNDFTDLMRHIKESGAVAERGAQGQRVLTSIALGGGGYFNPLFVGKVIGTGQGLRALFMTERGRKFLMTSGQLQPGSPRWMREANRFARYASRVAPPAAGRRQLGDAPPEPVEGEDE